MRVRPCTYRATQRRAHDDGAVCGGLQDKEKVAEYKANIKAQLTRAGLIRGQPRSVYASLNASSSTSVSVPTTSSSASSSSADRYAAPGLGGPGPSSLRGGRSEGPYASSYANVHGYDSSRFQQPNSVMSAMSGLGASSVPCPSRRGFLID